MKNILVIPAVALALGAATPAFAASKESTEVKSETKVEKSEDGSYERKDSRTTTSTDAAGTTTKTKTKVDVEADADGNGEKKVVTETVSDPKGLMNKSKTETTDTVKYKDGQVEKSHKKKVDGKVVEETKQDNKN